MIRTPDQRLRVFVSSTLVELSAERAAARRAIEQLRLTPIMFELGARPYPPRDLYRAYLAQSDVFVGIYWQSYGWVAPDESISGLEDEFRLSAEMPRLLYVREPAPDRDERLEGLLEEVRQQGSAAYRVFTDGDELGHVVAEDLAILLSERFEVVAPGAPSDGVGPADAVGADRAGTVIEPDNPIIGREEELAAILGLLRDPGVRIVTLTGAAGIGKSRLAIELAKLLRDDFEHGVWTIPLETVRDPDLVIPKIAEAVGVRSSGGDPLATLQSRLSDREALLVLDNFEHVTSTAVALSQLLHSSPDIRVLITSRTPLRIRGEHEYPVPPLSAPDPEYASADDLRRAPAVAMFLARATAVNPTATYDDDEMRLIARICRRLDGLPLAIELAAARSRLFSPHALLSRLDHRLPLLTRGTRDAPVRHRTLRAAIDWGHDLLDPDERTALHRLAVFSGGWNLAAQEAVLPAAGGLDVDGLDLLEALVLKSFVQRARSGGPEPRFTMLQTIREYAYEKLLASPDHQATAQAHADHYLAFAEQAAPQTHGAQQASWLDALERDHDNLRQALAWYGERGDVDRQLRLTAALGRFWMVHSHFVEGLRWLKSGRDAARDRQDELRANVLSWLGTMAWLSGDVALSETAHAEALPIRRAVGDRHGEHIELLSLGIAAYGRGDPETAATRWRDVLRLAGEVEDLDAVARANANLGFLARTRGDLDAARPLLERAIDLHQRTGDFQGAVIAILNLAGVALDLGNLDEAEARTVEAMRQAASLGDTSSLAEGLELHAAVRAAAQRPDEAGWFFGAAETLRRRNSLRRLIDQEPIYQRDLARARESAAQQGRTATFEEAWRAGAAAPRDEVMALAQKGHRIVNG